ncbi:uncharacterized protein L3040_007758 [Drepanopeziza brunnea f. sp. 'multigermtubi']|uniref:uncharacterized protein n=1 Tax=Drepanopeziza brunnea f. sp. 'multigermtubi' TaxID=698441 RepID=UPI00239E6436|nr:hypothetical protein L3040_007758 [Drepanopeziza brunnea f. sp. 'multigermtubi']
MTPLTHLLNVILTMALLVSAHPVSHTSLLARSLPAIRPSDPKRGLVFHDAALVQKWSGAGSQVSWAYNWDSSAPADLPPNLEFVPMLWGAAAEHTTRWAANANAAIARGASHLLSFNEPDYCTTTAVGACLSPKDAANAYRKHMNPFAGRAYLGAPAVTNGPSGMKWLKQFLALCTGCQIDFVPIHWYDSATNVAYFKNYLADAHAVAGKNIWITEFNGSGSAAEKTAFLKTVTPWMDAQPYITRYAWFWCDAKASTPIVDGAGNPTALGKVYGYTAS